MTTIHIISATISLVMPVKPYAPANAVGPPTAPLLKHAALRVGAVCNKAEFSLLNSNSPSK